MRKNCKTNSISNSKCKNVIAIQTLESDRFILMKFNQIARLKIIPMLIKIGKTIKKIYY